MMNIVLVHAMDSSEPKRLFTKKGAAVGGENIPNMGLLYIASNLDPTHQVFIIDNKLERLKDIALFNQIVCHSPDVVGFSGTIFEEEQSIRVSQMLQREGITTLYGGPNATLNPEKFKQDFNFIVMGEGEITVNELLATLAGDGNVSDVKGICYADNGTLRYTAPRPRIKDLDSLNFPNRDLIPLEKYSRKLLGERVFPVDVVVSSRGCPYNCNFCSSSACWQRIYTVRSAENIGKEIAMLKRKYGTRGIFFREDNFTVNRRRVLELCEVLKKADVKWWCESRVDLVDKKMLKKMRDAGCSCIFFGIESGSEKTLRYFRKGFTIEQAKNAIKWCKDVGIESSASFMLGAPYEDENDIRKTISFAFELWPDWINFSRFQAIPVSETYYDMKKEGLITVEWNGYGIGKTKYVTEKKLTKLSLLAIRQYKWKKFTKDKDLFAISYFVPNFVIKWVKKLLGKRFIEIIKRRAEG